MRAFLACMIAVPLLLPAQDIVMRDGRNRRLNALMQDVTLKPHVLVDGAGRVDFPRDSTIGRTLIVLGRPTYLASHVEGDVVVIGADLFLRPGAEITGRAVAIGGSVSNGTFGHVLGGIESFRDDSYVVARQSGGYVLTYRVPRKTIDVPVFDLAGLQGLLAPSYDRVDGLSLPVGAIITLGGQDIELEPTVTYRSRLGTLDPAIDVRVRPQERTRFEGRLGRFTRSNEAWNYGDGLNSLTTFFEGLDTRNYFRSTGGEGRVFSRIERPGLFIEPFIGARYEQVDPVSATGDVFTIRAQQDTERTSRRNPLVEPGTIGSLLVGGKLLDTAGVVRTRATAELEQSFATVSGTSNFTQLTLDARVEFPTFGTQRLLFDGRAVATAGGNVSLARFAYLGGSGSLPILDLLEIGGSEVLFLESRYTIPIGWIVLPALLGSPHVSLRHLLGAAGVGSLGTLEQEIGLGLGVSVLRLDVTTDAGGKRGTKIGLGFSLSQ